MKYRQGVAIVMFLLMSAIGLMMWCSCHEEAHKQIFMTMCDDAKVVIKNDVINMVFHGGNAFMYTEMVEGGDCDPNMQLAHSINESVGYQLGPLLAIIMATLLAMFTYMMLGDE